MRIPIEIGAWPSGLYFAKLTAPGRIGYAPFVVRPAQLGERRVAVVLPTRTWQAYNFRDDDGDGTERHLVRDAAAKRRRGSARPFLNRGVPPHFRRYDLRIPPLAPRHGPRASTCSRKRISTASARRAPSRARTS